MPERAGMVDGVPAGQYVPTADQRVALRLTWNDFQAFLAMRGDSGPRVTYSKGTLELMSPSRTHETLRAVLGAIIQEYFRIENVPCIPTGSWLLSSDADDVALEPDDSYVLHDPTKTRPDLAIEVIWTSGGIKKLQLYERLFVPEVWFWKDDELFFYVLTPDGYEESDRSSCLPRFDKSLARELLNHQFVNDIPSMLRERLR